MNPHFHTVCQNHFGIAMMNKCRTLKSSRVLTQTPGYYKTHHSAQWALNVSFSLKEQYAKFTVSYIRTGKYSYDTELGLSQHAE